MNATTWTATPIQNKIPLPKFSIGAATLDTADSVLDQVYMLNSNIVGCNARGPNQSDSYLLVRVRLERITGSQIMDRNGSRQLRCIPVHFQIG